MEVLLGLVFVGTFLILVGIGAEAPPVLTEFKGNAESTSSDGKTFHSSTMSMDKEHQLFWLDIRLSNGKESSILSEGSDSSGTVKIDVQLHVMVNGLTGSDENSKMIASFEKVVTQTCHNVDEEWGPNDENKWCEYFFVWRGDFIEYDRYNFVVRVPDPDAYREGAGDTGESLFDIDNRVTAINPAFTRFMIGWKYTWLVATLLVMFCPCGMGFISALRKQYRETGQHRTYHQRWTASLLWGLVWFNDPFVAATVYTNGAMFFSGVFILSASIFLFLILLFWLCLLSDVRFMQRNPDEVRRGICYWVPKVILTLAIAVTLFSGYMYYRFEDTVDPVYTGLDDDKNKAEVLAGLLGFMMAIYMLWVLILVLRASCLLRRISASHMLLFFLTLVTWLMAVIGVFVAAYYPYSTSGEAFLGVHGVLNLYVWTLAVCFTPVSSTSDAIDKPPEEMAAVVVGTGDSDPDIARWTDSEFKAVEL